MEPNKKTMQTLLSRVPALSRLRYWLIAGLLLGIPTSAWAHERFIAHTPKMKIYEPFFDFLGGNMLNIATRVAVIMGIMMFVWFIREPLDSFIHNVIAKPFPDPIKGLLRFGTNFAFDKPIDAPWYKTLHSWCVIFFVRCPALVLMFAAANKSLVMPSYPLEPSTVFFFQFAQVVMAIGILTQSFLPFGGATIFGTFIYLLIAFDWKIAVDVLPVLTVGVIYVTSPWDSWKRVIMTIGKPQMKWVQFILGLGFFLLGWMKLYNYYLTVGVADNYPEVLNDPMVLMFYAGTSKHLARECWIMAFGMAEVMTGFLVMIGMFSRIWCFMMVYLFSKLMLVNFGWDEIPHLYPIGAFLVVMSSNNLSNAFEVVDKRAEVVTRTGKNIPQHIVLSLLLAACLSALAVYPMLWFLTKTHPKPVPVIPATAKWTPGSQGDGTVVITIPRIPIVASEEAKMHFRIRAQVTRGTALDSVEWVDKDFPQVENATAKEKPIRTNEAVLTSSEQPRQIMVTLPPSSGAAGQPSLNSIVLSATRVEDAQLQAPESFNVALDNGGSGKSAPPGQSAGHEHTAAPAH